MCTRPVGTALSVVVHALVVILAVAYHNVRAHLWVSDPQTIGWCGCARNSRGSSTCCISSINRGNALLGIGRTAAENAKIISSCLKDCRLFLWS